MSDMSFLKRLLDGLKWNTFAIIRAVSESTAKRDAKPKTSEKNND